MYIAIIKDAYDDNLVYGDNEEHLKREVDTFISDNMGFDDEYEVIFASVTHRSNVKYDLTWTNPIKPEPIKPTGPEI